MSHPDSRLLVILDSDRSGADNNPYVIASFLDQFSQTRPDGTVNALFYPGTGQSDEKTDSQKLCRNGIALMRIIEQSVRAIGRDAGRYRKTGPQCSAWEAGKLHIMKPVDEQRLADSVELVGEILLGLERLADISEAVRTELPEPHENLNC